MDFVFVFVFVFVFGFGFPCRLFFRLLFSFSVSFPKTTSVCWRRGAPRKAKITSEQRGGWQQGGLREIFRNFLKIFRFWLGGADPQTPRFLAGGAKPPQPKTGGSGGQRPPAKIGKKNNFFFFFEKSVLKSRFLRTVIADPAT